MKVIDILNKIANEEKIGKFEIMGDEHYVDDNNCLRDEYDERVDWYIDDEWLNTPVEIIEDKKIPKKIDDYIFENGTNGYRERLMKDKINEIIDYLEENNNE